MSFSLPDGQVWLVDACVLVAAQDATPGGHDLRRVLEALSASPQPFRMSSAAYSEVVGVEGREYSGKALRKCAEAANVLQHFTVERLPKVMIDDSLREYRAYRRLRAGGGHNHEGEYQAIAWASTRSELVFVSHDRGAVNIAVGELQGRVRQTPTLLAYLIETGGLDVDAAERILPRCRGARRPAWWDEVMR